MWLPVYRSLRDFLLGIIRRFYFWLFAFFFDPWDVFERLLTFTVGRPVSIPVPPWVFWGWLGCGIALAVFMTYHELHTLYTNRMEAKALKDSLGGYLIKLQGIQQRCTHFDEDPELIQADAMTLNAEIYQFFQVNIDMGELAVFSAVDVRLMSDPKIEGYFRGHPDHLSVYQVIGSQVRALSDCVISLRR
ncbi:MAG: hypothetical protein A3H96_12575 [Acidobacteria bacterium RIFCSPLOWO2_02_FULL_67_36]|nr:MAG: hypothetical protein A3H96_12575 [Acidobacteria bacterium RIFCSPLOWO2_02_FULL_67_36]